VSSQQEDKSASSVRLPRAATKKPTTPALRGAARTVGVGVFTRQGDGESQKAPSSPDYAAVAARKQEVRAC